MTQQLFNKPNIKCEYISHGPRDTWVYEFMEKWFIIYCYPGKPFRLEYYTNVNKNPPELVAWENNNMEMLVNIIQNYCQQLIVNNCVGMEISTAELTDKTPCYLIERNQGYIHE